MKFEQEIKDKIDRLQQIANQEYKSESRDQEMIDSCMDRCDELFWVLGYYDDLQL